jgi:hypothetical protein
MFDAGFPIQRYGHTTTAAIGELLLKMVGWCGPEELLYQCARSSAFWKIALPCRLPPGIFKQQKFPPFL